MRPGIRNSIFIALAIHFIIQTYFSGFDFLHMALSIAIILIILVLGKNRRVSNVRSIQEAFYSNKKIVLDKEQAEYCLNYIKFLLECLKYNIQNDKIILEEESINEVLKAVYPVETAIVEKKVEKNSN